MAGTLNGLSLLASDTGILFYLLCALDPTLSQKQPNPLDIICNPNGISLKEVLQLSDHCSFSRVADFITRQFISLLLTQKMTYTDDDEEKQTALLLLYVTTSTFVGSESLAFCFHHLSSAPCLIEMIADGCSSNVDLESSEYFPSSTSSLSLPFTQPNSDTASESSQSRAQLNEPTCDTSWICVSLFLTLLQSDLFPHFALSANELFIELFGILERTQFSDEIKASFKQQITEVVHRLRPIISLTQRGVRYLQKLNEQTCSKKCVLNEKLVAVLLY